MLRLTAGLALGVPLFDAVHAAAEPGPAAATSRQSAAPSGEPADRESLPHRRPLPKPSPPAVTEAESHDRLPTRGVARLNGAEIVVTRRAEARDCPAAVEIGRAVERLLRSEQQWEGADLRLDVELGRDESDYIATISASGKTQGTRTLRAPGPGCDELAHALAVTLAMILDAKMPRNRSGADADGEATAGARNGHATGAPATPEGPPHGPASIAVDHPRWSGRMAVGAAATHGLPLGLSGSVWGGFALEYGGWTGMAAAFWTPPRRIDLPPGTVSVQLAGGRGHICHLWRVASRQVHIGPCTHMLMGALSGEGRGFESNERQRRPWYAAGGGMLLEAPLRHRLAWSIEAAGLALLWSERFSVTGLGPAYSSDSAAVWIGGALAYEIF